MLGYTRDELLAMSPEALAGLAHPEDYDLLIFRHRARLRGGEVPPSYEVRLIHRDGSIR